MLNILQKVNTFMVNVGRYKRWTKPSVYRMMPWQHPSARKIPRKVFFFKCGSLATIEIVF